MALLDHYSNGKFNSFTDGEKHLPPMPRRVQGELFETNDTIPEPEVIEEPVMEEVEETPTVTHVLDAYFKGAMGVEAIAARFKIETADVVAFLKDYRSGKYHKRQFASALHDEIVSYALTHKNETVASIEARFFLRQTAGRGIISGRYYNGTEYTKDFLKAEWERRKERKTEPEKLSKRALIMKRLDEIQAIIDSIKTMIPE